MIKQNKQLVLTIIIGIFILSFANISYSRLAHNWSDCAYEGECDGGESTSLIGTPMSVSMHTYIVEGAGYFLESYSGMQAFLNRVEVSELKGINYNEIREILYKVIINMERARVEYFILKIKADHTPYKWDVIKKLLEFDFDGFQEKNGLLPSIFEKVEGFLRSGDVRGIYSDMLAGTEEILFQLYEIKESVDADQFPDISALWRINQDYSERVLFGQFSAQIFHEILFKNKIK
jgi:hypothetical protein